VSPSPREHAVAQYAATDGRLAARIALHQGYSTNPQAWFAWLAERLPRAGDVLEAGAGTGALWEHAGTEDPATLTLTDFSAAMCARLRRFPAARVVRADVTRLPFAAGSFDVVVANHMLYHLDDPGAGLRELARVLRPGGRLAASTNGPGHLAELDALGPAVGRPETRVGTRLSAFDAESGPPLVARHFAGVAVEPYPCDLRVPEPEPILAYLDSLADTPLTAPERAAATALVRARIAAEGAFTVAKRTVLITATRP
jgi:SAM-dependent methyltransferase